MTQKKVAKSLAGDTNLSFSVEGIDEYSNALSEVLDAFTAFKETAKDLQQSTDRLNAIEIKITSEQS